MNDIEKRARELLADEYDKRGSHWHAMRLRKSTPPGFEAEVNAVIAGLCSPIKLPDGYAIVPIKPSDEMRKAGRGWAIFVSKAWSAMLAARPEVEP
ncbi:hypothetical protein V8017_16160 [Stenotrophomonas rhizophila]